jgi:OOP family OmpA-OmpF porin
MRNHLKVCIVFALFAFLFGCATQAQKCTRNQAQSCPPVEKSGSCIQKVDNVLVILDTSETMALSYKGVEKLKLAKDIVASMDQSIPDIKLNAGLRDFGRGYTLFSINQSTLLYGMTPYAKGGLSDSLDQVNFAGGDSPMSKALNLAAQDLKAVSGRTAVIVVSDGIVTDTGTLQAAENLKKTYGENLCIYTIQIGDNYDAEKLLAQIAKIGGCGFSVNADEFATCDAMAAFVKKVFFEKGAAAPAKMIINSVLFDFDSNVVKPEAAIVLEQAAIMLQQDSRDIVVEGHTCSLGSEAYNMGLSERRANAVRDFLIGQGVDGSRLIVRGVGEAEPVADNTTSEGREQNRRVEFEIM